jgi:hypothetical protein
LLAFHLCLPGQVLHNNYRYLNISLNFSLHFCQVFFHVSFLYTRSPEGEGGILFYLCPSVHPSKINKNSIKILKNKFCKNLIKYTKRIHCIYIKILFQLLLWILCFGLKQIIYSSMFLCRIDKILPLRTKRDQKFYFNEIFWNCYFIVKRGNTCSWYALFLGRS